MQMESMELGLYATNCYLLWDEAGNGVVIDPGYCADRIVNRLHELKVTPLAILLTHGHFDHVGAVQGVAEAFGCPVYLPQGDTALPPEITNGPIPYTHTCSDGDVLRFGALTLTVLTTPGHTPGASCFSIGDLIFTGDTLFRGECGRTDLPGGSWPEMLRSLRRLDQLVGDRAVYPGHGEASTLSRERQYNPYLREARR